MPLVHRLSATLLLASGLAGCFDARLDVLESLPDTHAGAAGAAPAGGSAGMPGSGGRSGSGGSSNLPSPFVLDDFEDGDSQSASIVQGYWYFTPDPTCAGGFSVEIIAGDPDNTHALRTRGGGCSAWGALVGLDIAPQAAAFDASSFDELRFRARAEPGSHPEISVSLLDPLHFDRRVTLGSEWRDFVLPLDEFVYSDTQPEPQTFDVSELSHLQFFVFDDALFDFWLDDIAFQRRD